MFKGGSACQKIDHGEEGQGGDGPTSSSSGGTGSSASIDTSLCFTGVADTLWRSPIDMSKPEISDGSTDTDHPGYTGVGFYNLTNASTSKAVYNITSDQSASNARVMVRYAFAGTANRDMKITIDKGTYDVAFPPTGSWDKWDTVYIEDVWVDALDFQVTLASTTNDGGPNVDMIAFDIKGVYRTGCSPAKVVNDANDTTLTIVKPVREMRVQPATAKTFNALGRKVPASESRRNQPAGRYYSR